MKEQMFKFLQRKTPNLLKVKSVKLKDIDDDNGSINEHYIVNCLLQTPDTSIPINNVLGRKEKICLVNVSVFNDWLNGENCIKWLN